MRTHVQPQQHITCGPADEFRGGRPVRARSGGSLRTCPAHATAEKATPALMLMLGVLFLLAAACSQQPGEDMLAQMNARLDQLEKKITELETKDAEFTELVNDGKAGTIKLEEGIAALTQQVEKIASRPSAPSVRASAPPSGTVSPGRKHHTVAPGETLYRIAKQHGLSVDDLRRINNLEPGQPIQAGQKLLVAQ